MNTTIAYLAGIIDGEGYVALAKRNDRPNGRPTIQVQMACKEIVELLASTFGGTVRPCKIRGDGRKQLWRWRLDYNRAKTCLENVLPFLIEKREAALVAMAGPIGKPGRPSKASPAL